MITEAYNGLRPYFGDLHNHCAIGYGHGTIAEAFSNARLQLDFACVTPHAWWSDIPAGDDRLGDVVDYHQRGFQRAADGWEELRSAVEANYQSGKFVTFMGFEWHSLRFGDHHVLFKTPGGAIIRAADLDEMRDALRRYAAQDVASILVPHHIGYKQGYRGINWDTYTSECSPVVEIISMHGVSESDDAPYPYLHTMGPRDGRSTLQYGLARGHVAGVIGSTDHHSAHPGSYGHGRAGVWASALTRDGIWEALVSRRTYALTGDRIVLAFSLNGAAMGSIAPAADERAIAVAVTGGDALDAIELLHNNRVIRQWSTVELTAGDPFAGPCKVHFEVGWAEKGKVVDWEAALEVRDGTLLSVEPRFRGDEVVAPQGKEAERYAFSRWEQGGNVVSFATRTWGNPTTTTASTQGVCLEILGDARTTLRATINGKREQVRLADLLAGSQAGYLGGFLTPAYLFHKAVPRRLYHREHRLVHRAEGTQRDWYYVRVRQKNDQCAWSSPIWVEAS